MQQSSFHPGWLVLGVALAFPNLADAQDRRGRLTPGLVLETGARHALCDVLQFTPDGKELLTAGDDKVVRVWPVGKDTLNHREGRILRWPIFREQRGGIFALAQSPNDGGARIVIGGFAIKTGLLFLLDQATGDILRVLDKPGSDKVVWSIAWSSDGRYIVYGTGVGELFVWDLKGSSNVPTHFAGTGGKSTNHVRCLTFLDSTRFVCVTEDGWITLHDVRNPGSKTANRLIGFSREELIFADVSPNKRWLAAAFQNRSGEPGAKILRCELLDLKKARAEGAKAVGVRQFIDMPQRDGFDRTPMALAFDPDSKRIAVGMQEARHLQPGAKSFGRVTGGLVHVWALNDGKPSRLTTNGLEVGYRPDTLAFRPGVGDNAWQLAIAGGPNHEVRLWDIRKESAPLTTVRSPGSNLWSVAFSTNGKYLAWKDKLNTNPFGPNDRGTGPWRVFALEEKVRRIMPGVPADFTPVAPITTYEGWSVKIGGSSFRWRVVGPAIDVELSDRTGLYREGLNQIPRCYTFLKPPPKSKKPPRLAIGHMWGVSIYELLPGEVRLVRMLSGHESEVMSVAPSADGKLLVTAARDQTIACWSLVDWPSQPELGASFKAEGGKLLVRDVDPGSPAWEAELTPGDVMDVVAISQPTRASGPLYNPKGRLRFDAKKGYHTATVHKDGEDVEVKFGEDKKCDAGQIAEHLRHTSIGRQHLFIWHDRESGKERLESTTIRQRPLWRFFPTRKEAGNNWILWRWRDYYYDTTAVEPDRLLGWQVNPENLLHKPEFHPLSHLSGGSTRGPKGERKGFHNPDKVWKFITSTNQEPEKVIFPDLEPPEVRLDIDTPADAAKKQPLVLRATVRPRNPGDKQKLRRVTLWLDDFQFAVLAPNAKGTIEEKITVPLERLRLGRNEIMLSAFNNEGGRGQHSRLLFFEDPTRGKPRLHALCIGVDNYEGVKGFDDGVSNLRCSESDARALVEVFRQHKDSELYRDANVVRLLGKEVTRSAVLGQLRKIAKEAKSDDWVVLFLSGHGMAEKTKEAYKPGSFAYVCANSDEKRRETTMVSAEDLTQELGAISCRKLILMDACHSGSVLDDPVRALNQDGPHFLIFAACKADETAIEPNPKVAEQFPELRGLKHGLFTEGLLFALGHPDSLTRGARRSRTVTGSQVADRVKQRVDDLIAKLSKRTTEPLVQTPVFEPRRDDKRLELNLFCRP